LVHPVMICRSTLRSWTLPALALVFGPVIAFGCAKASDDTARLAASTSGANAAFSVAGMELTLTTSGQKCAVSIPGSSEPVLLDLDLPCHVMFWSTDPPERAGEPSGGLSVGGKGDAMAWRYPDVGSEAVVAVLGDPVVEHIRTSDEFAEWLAMGWRCSGSLQALHVGDAKIEAGSKREGIGAVCVERGLDETGFWLLAHPPQ